MNAINRPRRELANGATLSPLVVEATGETHHGRRVWRVVHDFVLRLRIDDQESYNDGSVILRISVPSGFETDFASVPRLFWRLWPHDEAAEAAVVHDWLYSQPDADRLFADAMLALVMRLTGKPRLMRWAFYLAVRLGGRSRKTRNTKGQTDS